MKSGIEDFLRNILQEFSIFSHRTTIMTTIHVDTPAFLQAGSFLSLFCVYTKQ